MTEANRACGSRGLYTAIRPGAYPSRDFASDHGIYGLAPYDNGENMDNNYEQDEICHLRSFDSYQEMQYKFRSLRSLVCDLLKTNQELRNALVEARSGAHCSDGPQPHNTQG